MLLFRHRYFLLLIIFADAATRSPDIFLLRLRFRFCDDFAFRHAESRLRRHYATLIPLSSSFRLAILSLFRQLMLIRRFRFFFAMIAPLCRFRCHCYYF